MVKTAFIIKESLELQKSNKLNNSQWKLKSILASI